MRDRQFPTRQALPDNPVELKSFTEVHKNGISFLQQGKNSGNVHLQQWTKTKIDKIYPKLAKRKYGTPLPSEVAAAQVTEHGPDHGLCMAGPHAESSAEGNSGVPSKAASRAVSRTPSLYSLL